MSEERSETEARDHAWKMMEKFHACMLTTKSPRGLHARPMAPTVRKDERAIYFLTDAGGHSDDEIESDGAVCLAFADPGANSYVSVAGAGRVLNDRARIRDLWTPAAKAWWEGPDDPRIRVLEVTPREANYWDGPNAVVTSVLMAAAAMGAKPDFGESRKVGL